MSGSQWKVKSFATTVLALITTLAGTPQLSLAQSRAGRHK